MKLSAKFKKFCLVDSEPPSFCDFLKVALNPLDIFFLNFAESFIVAF